MTQFKLGDTVRCINNEDRDLTVGKEYVITALSHSLGERFLETINDEGDKEEFYFSRFALIEEPPMNTCDTLEQKIQQTQAQLDELQQALTEAQKPKPWPQEGDRVWMQILQESIGRIQPRYEIYEGNSGQKAMLSNGRLFQTEQECWDLISREFWRTRLLNRIKELNEGWEPDWGNQCQGKRALRHCIRRGWVVAQATNFQVRPNAHYFKSEKIGDKLIHEFASDRLKLALL